MKKAEFDFQEPENAVKLSFLLGNGQVVLITSRDTRQKVNGILTASWMTPTSHFPLLISVSIGNGEETPGNESFRASYTLIQETNEFGLNLPSRNLLESIAKIGTLHSHKVDKYAETGLTPMKPKKISALLVEECFVNMECRVIDQYVTGDHTVFVGEPVFVHMDEDVFRDGKFAEKYRSKSSQVHFGDVVDLWNMW
jgi:flavin reductase (DIM6/NTAB) family NADH-FMN oxidoreductase RutF